MIFLPTTFFKEYGCSEHVQEIHAFLDSLTNKPQSTEIKLQMVIHARDYIIFTLCYINALTVSNVINITLQEVQSAKRDKLIKEAFAFKNNKYI